MNSDSRYKLAASPMIFRSSMVKLEIGLSSSGAVRIFDGVHMVSMTPGSHKATMTGDGLYHAIPFYTIMFDHGL